MKKAMWGIHAASIATLAFAVACGGSSGNSGPTGPSGTGGGGGGGAQSGATITIGANGSVSPAQVTIDRGQAVTFTNNSTRTRNIASDPHPAHSDCTALNSVNLLGAGQTKQTAAFSASRTCGFHDHDDPDNAALKGAIVVR